jgi:transcriptional regulator with XRE-family HTH domain
MDNLKEASINLAKALVAKEKTRKELVDKLGISESYLSRLLNGERIASIGLCKKVKKVYPDLDALCLVIQIRKVNLA